jgi:hypothetical protein
MNTISKVAMLALFIAAAAFPQQATVTPSLPQGSHVCFVRVPADLQFKIQCMQIPASGMAALRDKVQVEKAEDGVTALWRGPAHILFDAISRIVAATRLQYPPTTVTNAKTAQSTAEATLRSTIQSEMQAATPTVPGIEP